MTGGSPGRACRPPIDCGTNTIKLLIGDLHAVGESSVEVREMRMVRLGQGVDATGRLADEALERTFAAIDEYAALIAAHDVDRVRFCATSASRDAENAEEFVAGVRARLGVEPEVVSGDEEAALSFDGAVRNLRDTPGRAGARGGHRWRVDRAGPGDDVRWSGRRRVPRHRLGPAARAAPPLRPADDATRSRPAWPPSTASWTGRRCRSPRRRRSSGWPAPSRPSARGCSDLAAYDRSLVDQAVVAVDDVHGLVDRLLGMSHAERLELPWLHPGRADVIGAGSLILSRVLRRTGVPALVVSEADILDGIAWSIA